MSEAVGAGAARRRADADRGQDLPHRRPSRGRPGHRHLPHAGGGRRLGEARSDRHVPRAADRGISASPTPRTLAAIEARIEKVVQDALDFARSSPEPDPATVRLPRLRRADQPARGAAPAAGRRDRAHRAGSTRCATASPRRCGRTRTSSISAKAPASAAAASPTPRASGRSSAPSAWSTRRSPSRASPAPRSAPRRPARARSSDLMFADFVFETAGQIVLQAAKLRYMSNGQMNAPMVVRVGAGALRSAGPHHSGIYHPVFAHMPGLIVCVPSTPADAKGLMKTALRAGDPGHHAGAQGAVRLQGRGADRRALRAVRRRPHRARRATTSPSSRPARWCQRALEAAEALAARGHRGRGHRPPHDHAARRRRRSSRASRKTHRLLVVDEGWAMCGVGAEIAQAMNELAFDELDAPVGPAAHRADLASVRAGARARHAGRRRPDRRGARDGASPARRRCPTTGARSASAAPRRPRPAVAPRRKPAPPPAAQPPPALRRGRRADHHAVRRPHGQRRHDRRAG